MIPDNTLLESGNLPIASIARLAMREGQATRPIYRMHRWFARRLGSQFRAMLSALTLPAGVSEIEFWDRYLGEIPLDGARVLDPFLGGGTALIEARRAGASVLGYDIDPVASLMTRAELSAVSPEIVQGVSNALREDVGSQITPYHTTAVDGVDRTVLHHFWVQTIPCEACDLDVELHPHYQLAYDRDTDVQWVFCRWCHNLHELPLSRSRFTCSECNRRTTIEAGPISRNRVVCNHCRHGQNLVPEIGMREQQPHWAIFAQEYLVDSDPRPQRLFKAATDADRMLFDSATARLNADEEALGALRPVREIPAEGRLDGRPLIHGVRRYDQLFNARQLLHLGRLGRAIRRIEDETTRTLAGLAFSEHLTTTCMYTGYAFGYRRTSPLFSIHGYRHITRPVELNPWLEGIGRGTFLNALSKIRKALEFAQEPWDPMPQPGGNGRPARNWSKQALTPTPVGRKPEALFDGEVEAAVVNASSTDLKGIPDDSVDLVLTDPPYYDNVNYSELSDFYLAWHQVLGIAEDEYSDDTQPAPLQANLAVSESSEGAHRAYVHDLTQVLMEVSRVMKPDGVCVFTYHHGSAQAWHALAEALAGVSLEATAVVPLRGEGQGGLHRYDGTLKWDAVFVCRRTAGKVDVGALCVSDECVRKAAANAATAAETLGPEGIGFRQVDELNLFRAHLVSSAGFSDDSQPGMIRLLEALDRMPRRTNGKRTEAS